jgi:hypothetical protein
VEIVFGKIDAASVLANKWVSVTQLSPRLVELEARAMGKPHGWDSGVVERRSEFIEAGDAFSPLGNEGVDRYIENAGGLVQANLPLSGALILAEMGWLGREEGRKKKAGRISLPAFNVFGSTSQGSLLG